MNTTSTPQRMTESDRERILDSRIQARLTRDSAYRNAESAEDQAAREDEIEQEEVNLLEWEILARRDREAWVAS